jgi:alcohol dehydrogenase
MRALRLEGVRTLRPAEVEEPGPCGEEEALVRVHRVGICGTDHSAYLGKMPFVTFPRILGHELGVEVLAVGPGVEHVQVGDRCAVEPYLNDPSSPASRRGKPNCCERLAVLGVHVDGGMRPRLMLPARKLHPSARLSYDQLALVETLAIGAHAVSRSGLEPGQTCLLIGAGPIGLATLQFIRLAGGRPIVVDRIPSRLDFCRRLGVHDTLLAGEDLAERVRARNDGLMPDVVIDATGNPQSMSAALGLIAHGGKVVYVGLTGEEVRFRHSDFHRVEGTLLCSRNALPDDFRRIIGLIEAGRIDTRPWMTHRCTLDELPEAMPGFLKLESGVVKAIVEVTD